MKLSRFGVLAATLSLFGCSSGGSSSPASSVDAGGVANTSWPYVYATYFAPGSIGHCGDVGCHGTQSRRGFQCATASGCFTSLTTSPIQGFGVPLVDETNPPSSLIADPAKSPVSWFNANGFMPKDAPSPNNGARDGIRAWLAAGAPGN